MDTVLHQEEENRKKGLITSIIVHIILLILIVLPLLTFPDPPPGQAGILISFGEPNVGQGEEEPAPAKQPEEVVEVDEPEPPQEEIVEREVAEKPKEKPKKKDSKKVNTDDNSKELALKKKREAEKKASDAAEKKRKADVAEAKRKADATAKKKAEKDKIKNEIGDLFSDDGKGKNSGSQGTSGKPGNAGNPDGDPNAKRLEGLGKGSGDVSGFGNRGFKRPSAIKSSVQEAGTVSLEICVDDNGRVTSAKPKLSGSTTQNPQLQKLAIANAKKYRFDKSGVDKQCGTIVYKFTLQ